VPENLAKLPDERSALISRAADWHRKQGRRIPVEYIEKDFWVTETLRSLSKQLFQDIPGKDGGTARARIVFKGGTSLSKAHGLINRFSEDIDLYVVMRFEPAGVQGSPDQFTEDGVGASRADTLFALLAKRVETDIGIPIKPYEEKTARSGTRRAYIMDYANGVEVLGALKPHVQIELTRMGNPEPNSPHKIQSLMAEFIHAERISGADFVEMESVTVDVLMPHRTLVEKLCALEHTAARVAEGKGVFTRMARHFYDVEALLGADSVIESLATEDIAVMAANHFELSRKARRETGVRPEGGFVNSVWLTNSKVMNLAREAYMKEVPELTYAMYPDFDDVLERIRNFAHVL